MQIESVDIYPWHQPQMRHKNSMEHNEQYHSLHMFLQLLKKLKIEFSYHSTLFILILYR